jgi:hypothetical protein
MVETADLLRVKLGINGCASSEAIVATVMTRPGIVLVLDFHASSRHLAPPPRPLQLSRMLTESDAYRNPSPSMRFLNCDAPDQRWILLNRARDNIRFKAKAAKECTRSQLTYLCQSTEPDSPFCTIMQWFGKRPPQRVKFPCL